nr:TerD family protein [Pseudonocardia sp. TRM90224]
MTCPVRRWMSSRAVLFPRFLARMHCSSHPRGCEGLRHPTVCCVHAGIVQAVKVCIGDRRPEVKRRPGSRRNTRCTVGSGRRGIVVELPKGGNATIVGPLVRSTLRTHLAPGQIDICALLVDDQRRTRSDEDFVFFNQERSRCGSTRRLSAVEIEVNLDEVPAAVDAIVIAASLDDGVPGSVADHGAGHITVAADPAVTHTFTGLTTERCVIAAEIYRRNGNWKVRAISQGFDDLAGLIAVFGVETEDDAPAPPPPAPPPPAPPARPADGAAAASGAPPQTREIVDRVRAGAAARRAGATPPPRLQTWLANLNARRATPPPQQLSAYRARRRAEAAQVAVDIAMQTQRVEQLLYVLPYPDLSIPALLDLIDASAAPFRQPRVRLFRRAQPAGPPAPPSSHLAGALQQLHRAASARADRDALHAWLWLGLHAMDLQPSFGHPEDISVAPDAGNVVVDVRFPNRTTVVPSHSRAVYTPGDDTIRFHPAKPKEQSRLANILFSAALLAHAHAAATATSAAGLPPTLPLVVNGWESVIDPATGRPDRICRATLVTSAEHLAQVDLRAVDPPACLRSFAGLSTRPAAYHPSPRPPAPHLPGVGSIWLRSTRTSSKDSSPSSPKRWATPPTAHPEVTTTAWTSTSNPATPSPGVGSSFPPSATAAPSVPTTSVLSTASWAIRVQSKESSSRPPGSGPSRTGSPGTNRSTSSTGSSYASGCTSTSESRAADSRSANPGDLARVAAKGLAVGAEPLLLVGRSAAVAAAERAGLSCGKAVLRGRRTPRGSRLQHPVG